MGSEMQKTCQRNVSGRSRNLKVHIVCSTRSISAKK